MATTYPEVSWSKRRLLRSGVAAVTGLLAGACGPLAGQQPGPAGPTGPSGRVDVLLYSKTKNPEGAWATLKWFEDEAMKLIAKEGHLQGTTIKAHMEQHFADPTQPPKNVRIWVESVLKWGRVPPSTLNWSDVERKLNEEFGPLWNGQRSAKDTVAASKASVDPLVLKGRLPD